MTIETQTTRMIPQTVFLVLHKLANSISTPTLALDTLIGQCARTFFTDETTVRQIAQRLRAYRRNTSMLNTQFFSKVAARRLEQFSQYVTNEFWARNRLDHPEFNRSETYDDELLRLCTLASLFRSDQFP